MNSAETVFDIIDGERDYQDVKWGKDHSHDVAAFVVFMREYHNQVVRRASKENGWSGALDELRKVAALGVACMEKHGVCFGDLRETDRETIYSYVERELLAESISLGRYIIKIGKIIYLMENKVAEGRNEGIYRSALDYMLHCVSDCVGCMMQHGVVARRVVQ